MTPEQIRDLREAHAECLRESRESLRRGALLLWAAAWGESETPATWDKLPTEHLRYLRVEGEALAVRDDALRYTVETATELWLLALVMRRELRVVVRNVEMRALPSDVDGHAVWARWVTTAHGAACQAAAR